MLSCYLSVENQDITVEAFNSISRSLDHMLNINNLADFRLNELSHTTFMYIFKEPNFNFRHVRLCDLNIPGVNG